MALDSSEHPQPPVDIMNDPAFAQDHANSEPDHCRICRSEGSPEEPLYYPCKCSGSIKFVHQDCLMEWLQHSQKKYCELCKTPFTFTKVYDPNMPQTLPTPLFLRQLVRHLVQNVILWARAVLVGLVWLGCLPWCVRWMWRGWFWVSDGGWWTMQAGLLASQTSERPPPPTPTESLAGQTSAPGGGRGIIAYLSSPGLSALMSPVNGGRSAVEPGMNTANATTANSTYTGGIFFDSNPFANVTKSPFLNRLIVDILEGQLLTALIVISFIIIFLIREWVVQQQPAMGEDANGLPLMNGDLIPAPGPAFEAQPDANADAANDEDEHVPAGQDVADEELLNRAFGPLRHDSDAEEDGEGAEAAERPRPRHRVFARPRRRRAFGADQVAESTDASGEGSGSDGNTERLASTERSTQTERSPLRPTPTREHTAQVASFRRELEETARPNSAVPPLYDFGGSSGSSENLFQFGSKAPEPPQPTEHRPLDPDPGPSRLQDFWPGDSTDDLETIDTGRTPRWRRQSTGEGSSSHLSVPEVTRIPPIAPVPTLGHADLPEHQSSDTTAQHVPRGSASGNSHNSSWSSSGSFELVFGPQDKGKGREEEREQGSDVPLLQHHNKVENDAEIEELDETSLVPISEGAWETESEEEYSKTDNGVSEWSNTAQASATAPSASTAPSRPASVTPPVNAELGMPERRHGTDLPRNGGPPTAEGLDEAIRDITARLEANENVPFEDFDLVQRSVAHLRQEAEHIERLVAEHPANNLPPVPARRGGLWDWFGGEPDEPAALPEPQPADNQDQGDETDNEELGDAQNMLAVGGNAQQVMADDDAGDDFEGIMELVGMRGPLMGLVQNAAISSMLITATVAIGVAFPYVTGKTVMMILAHPILFFFKLPMVAISFVAEFIVDSATFIAFSLLLFLNQPFQLLVKPVTYIMPGLSSFFANPAVINFLRSWATDGQNRVVSKFSSVETTYAAIRKYPPSAVPPLSMVARESWENITNIFVTVLEKIGLRSLTASSFTPGPTELEFSGIKVPNPVAWVYEAWEQTFSAVNFTRTFDAADKMREVTVVEVPYPNMAPYSVYTWSTWDRVSVVLLGYTFFTVAGMIYVKRRRGELNRNVERLIVEFLEQCGGVMKVVLIIGIEMFVFPLYCGLLLDVAMLPLFEGATLASRVQFAIDFPLTSIFVHWFVGTCYMFHFALFVSMCRKIMRTGVLYFIRDPDDPTFHPVRDVLDRPVIMQLRKIAFSGFIYGILVLLCLGGVVWGLYGVTENVLPIHWSSNEPVLEFPVDLLFYNFLMPVAVKFFKPSEGLQQMYGWWFRHCARVLRLSSFMFGERIKDEEGYHVHPTWQSYFRRERGDVEHPALPNDPPLQGKVYFKRTGRFVRAPASDSIRRPKGTSVFIPVDEHNRRLDVDPSSDPPSGPTGANSPDWKLVYIPPYFRIRVALVVLGIWVFAAVTGVGVTIGPLLLGRSILRHIVPDSVRINDIYAFSVGAYLVGGLLALITSLPTLARSLRWTPPPPTLLLRTLKVTYVFLSFALLLPSLVALCLELYIIIPIHTVFSPPSAQHTVHFIQDWTLGVLYIKMLIRLLLLDPDSRWSRSLRAIIHRGWFDPDVKLATKTFIAPAVAVMVAALLLPCAGAYAAEKAGYGGVIVWRFAFPATAGLALAAVAVWAAWRVVEGWKGKVRDEVYLRGVRVHNHGETPVVEM